MSESRRWTGRDRVAALARLARKERAAERCYRFEEAGRDRGAAYNRAEGEWEIAADDLADHFPKDLRAFDAALSEAVGLLRDTEPYALNRPLERRIAAFLRRYELPRNIRRPREGTGPMSGTGKEWR